MPILKICPTCHRQFQLKPSQKFKRIHCSKACQYRRVVYKCELCGEEKTMRLSEGKKRFCSDFCRLKWFANHFRAEHSPHWKGGKLPYYGPNWRKQRRKVRHRDGNICQHCGKHRSQLNEELSVAHIKPFREFGLENYKEANDLKNLISLCRTCHLKLDQPFRRKAKDPGPLFDEYAPAPIKYVSALLEIEPEDLKRQWGPACPR